MDKTFKDFLDEVRQENGISGIGAINRDKELYPIAIERYANYKAAIAFDECLGMRNSRTLLSVLKTLRQASETLLIKHNHDALGYEEINAAIDQSKIYETTINPYKKS